jgi:ribosome modulation factor
VTAYQQGYAIGLRARIARIPRFAEPGDRARWQSGFLDASQARRAAELTRANPFRFFSQSDA